jgi:hypothetical protein
MINLPEDLNISVKKLSSCFNNTTASYKFYWFLAILDSVSSKKEVVSKKELFCRMISISWYTVNYFHVSFGKFDKLQEAIIRLKEIEFIDVDCKEEVVFEKLFFSKNRETQFILNHFDKNVPHKFLSPWLGSNVSARGIYEMSQENYALPPYALYRDEIIIQPAWFSYFFENLGLLKSFCYWHLSRFVQARNPNLPDVTSKLIRPEKRGGLSKHKKDFWDIVIDKMSGIPCIYTDKRLYIGDYDVDHFIPFQFLAHDLMWNLIPASPNFNRLKSDKLPDLNVYFDKFYNLHMQAIEIVRSRNEKNKFLDDYLSVFSSLDINEQKYRECLEPLIILASNNGFQFLS